MEGQEFLMNIIKLRKMLEQFFIEDIGSRDLSSDLLFSEKDQGELTLIAKDKGTFCGCKIICEGFKMIDSQITVSCEVKDGEKVDAGTVIAKAKGAIQNLLKGERVILNLIQRMSGIATTTSQAVSKVKGYNTRICDTRKTMPGLRMLDKYSVRKGGGYNHRNGLYDAVMLKDNHIAFTGSIKNAVNKVKEQLGHTVKVEVEIETKQQLLEAIEAKADMIMFDNRTPTEISSWLPYVPNEISTEASGSITLDTIESYAKTGVQYISLGCLTHSVKALDISAKVTVKK